MEASPEFPDDLVATFCAVTGAHDEMAKRYLAAAAGNLDMAVNLYLEGDKAVSGNPSAPPPANNNPVDVEEYVRAPIQPRRSVLVGKDDDYGGTSGNTSGHREYHPISSYPSSAPINYGGSVPLVEPFRNFRAETSPFLAGSGGGGERGRRLAELFKPPTEIMFTGNFEAARKKSKEECRWLLVTIHNPTEFPCQQMVRDVWNDTTIQEFIRESLLFMFITVGTLEAQRYSQYYPFEGFPHWALIDPRTGKRVKCGLKVIKSAEMLMELVDYVADHPLAPPPPPRPPSASKRENPSVEADKEVYEAAGFTEHSSANDPLTRNPPPNPDSPVKKKSKESSLKRSVLPAEPAASDPSSWTIQFRLPDGSRQRRRFLRSDPVQILYDFVAEILGMDWENFEIQSHTQSFKEHHQDTLEQHELKNATLIVSLK